MKVRSPRTTVASGASTEESHHWQAKLDDFERLQRSGPSDARRQTIVEAGIQMFAELRDRAGDRERDERVFGFGAQ